MEAGRPNGLAMAYALKRRNMAHGGMASQEMDCADCSSGHCDVHGADMGQDDGDIVDRIMRKGMNKMSKGGMVANQEHGPMDEDLADFSKNEFDDLVLRDDLDQSYTGANSGDEIGDGQEDEDRRDIVSRIMKSRKMKDKMPIAGYGSAYGKDK